jgi:hypothetical protein
VGQSQGVTAAWLKFPQLTWRFFPQRYAHWDRGRYFYQGSSGFSAELLVEDRGLIVFYPHRKE